MLFHDGEMERVTRGEPRVSQNNLLGAFSSGPVNLQHLIDDAQQGVKSRLDGVPAIDGDVAMQDLLQDLGVRHQALALTDQLFEQSLRVALVGVSRAHKIHRDIRVDQNHGRTPDPYPASISASMRSISAVG